MHLSNGKGLRDGDQGSRENIKAGPGGKSDQVGLSRDREGPLTADGQEGTSRAKDQGARLSRTWRAEMLGRGGLAVLH